MTDVLDRLTETTPLTERDGQAAPGHRELSNAGRVVLAALSAAAGVIHLAMVPSHIGESTIEGVGFAVAGWFQLVVAVDQRNPLSFNVLCSAAALRPTPITAVASAV